MCEISQLILNEEMLHVRHFCAFVGAKTMQSPVACLYSL